MQNFRWRLKAPSEQLITLSPSPPQHTNTHRALMIRRPPTHCQETQAALCAVHSQQHPFIDCIQIKMHLWNSRPGSEHLQLSNHQQPVNSMAAQLHTETQPKIIIIQKLFRIECTKQARAIVLSGAFCYVSYISLLILFIVTLKEKTRFSPDFFSWSQVVFVTDLTGQVGV